ncbi:putative ribonuclease H-like domain-containing protein [Tanacetum coccineum]
MDDLERLKRQEKEANEEAEALRKKFEHLVIKEGAAKTSSTNIFSTVSTPAKASSTNPLNTASIPVSTASPYEGLSLADPTNPEEDDSEIPPLEDIYQNSTDGIFTTSSYDDEGAVADFTNLETVVNVSPIPTLRIHSTHPKALILGDPNSAVQTRSKVNTSSRAHAFVSYIQKVWVLVDLPYGKKAIGTKWVYRNKKDERGVVVRNKARLVAQGHRQEEGIDYDESIKWNVKSAFLYGKIDERGYVSQPPGFLDPKYPQKVYKVVKALYGLHQAPRAWYATLSTFLLKNGYRRGPFDKISPKKDKHDIILVQVYVDDIIFGSTKKSWCDEFEALMKSRFQMSLSMIGSLMYLTASRPDIMFAVCACSRFQVTPKSSHLSAVKRIFRYLKGKPKLGLWYPRVSSFDLESYSDSDYARANLDRKSTTKRLSISWQETHFLAMQKADHCGYFYYRSRVLKIYTDDNVADLLTKAFDVSRMRMLLQKDHLKHNLHPPLLLLVKYLMSHRLTHPLLKLVSENLGGHSSSDKSLSGNEGDMTIQGIYDLCLSLCKPVSDQAKEIQDLKAKITKLKKQAKPVIKHHKAYLKSVSLKQRFPRKSLSKKYRLHKEYVSKQGRKFAKGESSVQRDALFDGMPEDTVDHIETENAQDEGRTREMVDEDKKIDEVRLSTEDVVSTDKEGVSTDFEKVSTDRPIVSTDGSKVSTDEQIEGTEEPNEGTDENLEGTKEQNEDTVEIFEGTEEQREGTEEKVESTDGQIKGTEDQTEEEIATQATQTSTQTPTSMIFRDDETIATL